MRVLQLVTLFFFILAGDVMASSKELIDQLEKLKILFQKETENDKGDIEKIIKIESTLASPIPDEIKNMLVKLNVLPNEHEVFFLGYEALTVDIIMNEHYQSYKESGFFSAYSVDDQFNIPEDERIVIYDDEQKKLLEPIEVNNLSNYIPLFTFQGDYIVGNMEKSSAGELIAIVDGYNGGVLAPGVVEHLDDLLIGVKSGRYPVIDNEIIYPSVWYQRRQVQEGKLEGEIKSK